MSQLRIHYRTFGNPARDEVNRITNAVLLLHGTTGSGASYLASAMADPLFGLGKPLDASRYYLIAPDGIGCGKSTKPSDGLRGRTSRQSWQARRRADHSAAERTRW